MNGFSVVADTNVYFILFYKPESKSGILIDSALDKKIDIFSPDTVREELKRVIINELGLEEDEAEKTIEYLPTTWVEKEIYLPYMDKASVIRHKSDMPVLAVAIALKCGIITANTKDFKAARKLVKMWEIDELLQKIKSL